MDITLHLELGRAGDPGAAGGNHLKTCPAQGEEPNTPKIP